MKNYKIEITNTYCIDIQASTRQQAEELATTYLDAHMKSGTAHYYQTGDSIYTAFDVTNTDDPFDPLNK